MDSRLRGNDENESRRFVRNTIKCDFAIVGGGLAGGLIALALKQHRPELDVRLIEGEDRLGGNHVWSFFDTDIAPEDRAIVEPLIGWSWHGYDIVFPAHSRVLACGQVRQVPGRNRRRTRRRCMRWPTIARYGPTLPQGRQFRSSCRPRLSGNDSCAFEATLGPVQPRHNQRTRIMRQDVLENEFTFK